jgi:hypothetical protein
MSGRVGSKYTFTVGSIDSATLQRYYGPILEALYTVP